MEAINAVPSVPTPAPAEISPVAFSSIDTCKTFKSGEDPSEIVRKISDCWLNKGGRLIVGLDHYYENTDSHSWQEKVGTRMLMLKESEWVQIFEMAGFDKVKSWHSNKNTDWAGTLVITGKK